MHEIGHISLLQIQQASLKRQGPRFRYYDPAPLLAATELTLDPSGLSLARPSNDRLMDVHNASHPASKNRDGLNAISFSFTAHYAQLRARFGNHLTDGIAGENIVIDHPERWYEEAFRNGLHIQLASGGLVTLSRVVWAAPCVEFARFALQFPDTEPPDLRVSRAVQELSDGLRGFYAAYDGPPVILRQGDRVFVAGP